MNMLCLGWRTINTCGGQNMGRSQQIVPPTGGDGQPCPTAWWFFIGAGVIAAMAISK